MNYKMVIVVRDDLKLSPGKTAVQVAHAAVSCTLKAYNMERLKLRRWMDEGQRKVALAVPDLPSLMTVYTKAREAGLITEIIKDAGLTEIPPGTVTCIGIGPDDEKIIDKITGMLPLK